MNNAGLPGTGLGGLFYVLLALCMPLVELHATWQGRSSAARWRQVWTQFAVACGIVGAVVGTLLVYLRVADVPSTFGLSGAGLALAPVVLASVLLAVLSVTLRVWSWLLGPVAPEPVQPRAAAQHV